MAASDYGAIAFKNGKLMSNEMYPNMMDMVGWKDTEEDVYRDYSADHDVPLRLDGNYFAYIGDKDCTLAFYKTHMRIVEKYGEEFFSDIAYFGSTYFAWSKWKKWLRGHDVIVTKRNGYYVCKWKYKGDKYKVYFGYGVDLPYYKKYRMVNYYRSPEFLVYRVRDWIKDKIYEFKYCR